MNLGALKSGNFRAYVFGAAFGLLGLWMQRVAMGWLAWEMTGAPSFVGLVAMLLFAPAIVLSPLFGVLVDRVSVKRAILVVQGSNFLLCLLLWALVSLGKETPLMLAILSLLIGVVMAANHPVRMALTPRLVRREYVSSVVTIVAINFNVARMVGPAVGGVLIATIGVGHTLMVQWLLFVPYLFVLTRVTVRPRRDTGHAPEPFFKALLTGLRYVWQAAPVREAMFLGGALGLVARGALEVLPPLADGVFGRGADGLGLLTSVSGAGAVLGGFSQAALPPQAPGRLPFLSRLSIVMGLFLVVLLGMAGTWGMALTVAACMSFVTTLTAISIQTAVQLDLEDDMRGRVMSLWAVVAAGGAALGAGAIGVLADWLGFQTALIWTGSLSAICVTTYLFLARLKA
ncbi:MFS transporter [Shimia sp. NS0008-38b]|uniref:MFS transporter n=1 Tax=Shimia sp. NS0008-38b TaxID=3127653 RepID=UPI003107466B